MIRTIIFDLGKVIVPFDFNRAYRQMEACCGTPASEIPLKLVDTGLYRRFESGLIQPHEFVDEITAHLGISIGYKNFCNIWTSIFFPETLISDEFMAQLAQCYRLVLLSNTNVIHFEMVRAGYPILRHFQAFVLSYEVGIMKPAAGIYHKAIEAAQCKPEECFFIDDILENVEAAQAVGIDAVQFLSVEQLEKELRTRGIIRASAPEIS
jgi:FMN phosphatase YigB (HAD superfamily)